MKDYSNYKTKINMMEWSGQKLFNNQLEGYEGKSATIDGVSSNIIIQQSTNPFNESKEDRTLLCLNSTAIHRGSIVIYTEDSITKTHIVMTDIDTNGIYKSCKIRKCSNVLTFKSTSGSIVSYPCILTSDSYAVSGLDESKLFITDSKKRTVLVPYNADTKELFLQERLMFNHVDLYEINTIDHDSYFCSPEGELTEGVLKLTLESTVEIVGSDDKANNLAYNENSVETPTVPTGEYVVSIIGDETINADSSTIYTAKIYNNGTEVINLPVTWDLLDATGTNILSSSIAYLSNVVNNSITINAVGSDNYITLKATLNADVSKFATLQIYISSGW